jgi:CheY-like chemotaxis protein
MSVLIIEDDEGVRESIAGLLRDEGYDVDTAGDGQEALDKLSSEPYPTLIVLDLMMPGMPGEEFRARQLSDPKLADIPVIIISARPDVARRAQRLRADDYLAKPMSFEALIHAVQNRAVTQAGARGEANRPGTRGLTLKEAWALLNRREREDPKSPKP